MQEQFVDVLKEYVDERKYTPGQLNKLTGIPIETIKNWLTGRVKKPRDWRLLIDLAVVLRLNQAETNRLLHAAHYPPIGSLPLDTLPQTRQLSNWLACIQNDFQQPDPPSPQPVPPYARQPASHDRTILPDPNRSRMLEKVKTFWIKGILEHSLSGMAPIDLRLEYRPDAIYHPWDTIIRCPRESIHLFPPGIPIVDVFHNLGGELLILGAPGAGKTRLLLELARALINEAEREHTRPIPVIFHLGSWTKQYQSLAGWLAEELTIRYEVPRQLSTSWVATNRVLPLLDGLDEIKRELRAACVGAINDFHREHGLLPIAACCRLADYEILPEKLHFQGALYVQPLSAAQVDTYLAQAGDQLAPLRTALADHSALQELAQSPLMLRTMIHTFQQQSRESPHVFDRPDVLWHQLFSVYVDRMFQHRLVDSRYSQQRMTDGLAWLAHTLSKHDQTIFSLDQLQPAWVPTPAATWRYSLLDRLLFPLAEGTCLSLVCLGMVAIWPPPSSGSTLADGLTAVLQMIGLVGVFIFGIAGQLRDEEFRIKRTPTLVSRHSTYNAASIGIALGIIGGLMLGIQLGAWYGAIYGCIAGLAGVCIYGGHSYVSHIVLRYTLWRSGALPWNYTSFLDEATQRLFLRKDGNGYTFTHRLLRDYFAALHAKKQKPSRKFVIQTPGKVGSGERGL